MTARPLLLAGLTGGIATGKSTVSEMLGRRGSVLIDADVLAREVVEPGEPALAQIVEEFGPDVLQSDGRLDRKKLGAVVFADATKRKRLEAITHPAIRERFARHLAELMAQGFEGVVFFDAPVLAEAVAYVHIPRTHNDYADNSKTAAAMVDVRPDSAQLVVPPIAHNLPLACPGIQGFFLNGARAVLSTSVRGADVFPVIARERITHLAVVPAVLIRWINDPSIGDHDLSSARVIQCGGQRLQPEVKRLAEERIPSATLQENFGMAEGMLTFGRSMCPDDEVKLVDDEGREVPDGEVGEFACRGPYTLRGYYKAPEHNARAFTPDRFYRSGDLMRRHPSGNLVVEGRKKDLINRGGEKISAVDATNPMTRPTRSISSRGSSRGAPTVGSWASRPEDRRAGSSCSSRHVSRGARAASAAGQPDGSR